LNPKLEIVGKLRSTLWLCRSTQGVRVTVSLKPF
jgi:hypothetical protein